MTLRPPGSPLYWRLFLTVAAAILLFIVFALVTTALLVSHELEGYVHARQSPLGREAANAFSAGGADGLRTWLERSDTGVPRDVTIYVLAPDGSEIRGRELPGWAARMMRAIAAHGPDAHPGNYRPTVLAPQLIGRDGAVLSMFVMPRNVGPWGSSTTTLALLTVALLVIAAAAWLVARALTRPLMELQLAVRGLASGRVDARVPTRIAERADEIGALAMDFNAMADRLANLLEYRQRLLRDVSHELRSPLTRLQAATVLSAHREGISALDRERIEREIRRMDILIGDILRYSRLDDATSMTRRLVRLDDVLREIVEDAGIEAAGRVSGLRCARRLICSWSATPTCCTAPSRTSRAMPSGTVARGDSSRSSARPARRFTSKSSTRARAFLLNISSVFSSPGFGCRDPVPLPPLPAAQGLGSRSRGAFSPCTAAAWLRGPAPKADSSSMYTCRRRR